MSAPERRGEPRERGAEASGVTEAGPARGPLAAEAPGAGRQGPATARGGAAASGGAFAGADAVPGGASGGVGAVSGGAFARADAAPGGASGGVGAVSGGALAGADAAPEDASVGADAPSEGASDGTLDDAPDGTPDDASWNEADDDRTGETLRWLRDKRRAHRRQKGREVAVVVYTLLVAALGYGGGYAFHFLRNVELGADYSGFADGAQRVLPALFALLTCGLALAAARDALWRGPVVVPGPSVGWLLAQPVRRARVLRPWFWLSAGLAVASALLPALGGAVALRVVGLAPAPTALLALLPAAVCLPLQAVCLAMAVERRPALARAVRRWTPAVVVALMLLTAQFAAAASGRRLAPLETVELWSGPWGWAAQPVLAATGAAAPAWPLALALLGLLTAAGLVLGHRDAAHVPNAQLRRRAATAQTVTSVLWTVELRAARLALLDAVGDGRIRRVRLPVPRSRRLVVVWRDAQALLRAPGRLAKALMWTVCAAGTAALGVQLDGGKRMFVLALALFLGYVAVGALAEPARLETDDVRRAAWAPYRFRTLMLQHAIVPAGVGALLGLLAGVPFAVAGAPWALLLMPVCAVPCAAAAVFAACRGPMRTHLLFTGVTTPVGDPGVLVFFAWYAAGPLLTVGGLLLALGPALTRGLDAAAVGNAAAVTAVLTAVLLYAAGRAAGRLVRR
ncbi:hypothetical protein ACFP1Z_07980 [Streptomyces gamaensis]|uniref:ABC transporter permease n=1 Tax=Streptomyces gamaensis TaxID=1763542 RepID=A0ABW0YXC6_9ACTN